MGWAPGKSGAQHLWAFTSLEGVVCGAVTLQALVETGAARKFRGLREGEAWRLELRLGVKWLPVRSRREPVQLWHSLTAVGRFCEGVRIKVLTVEF